MMEKPKCSKQKNPAKAIRAYCLNCCLESAEEVRLCPAEECELWEFRFGKNPYLKREYTDEQREAMRNRAKSLFKHDELSLTNDSAV